jgi:hypothetical protein
MRAYETVYLDSYSSSDTLSVVILAEPPFGRSDRSQSPRTILPPKPAQNETPPNFVTHPTISTGPILL